MLSILLEHSARSGLYNMGDIAMLQVAVERIRALWPRCTLYVVSPSQAQLKPYVDATAVAPAEVAAAVPRSGAVPSWVNRRLRPVVANAMARAYCAFPAASRVIAKGLTELSPGHRSRRRRLRSIVRAVDAVFCSGGGYFADVFPRGAHAILDTLQFAQRNGKPTILFGQGIGPLTDAHLRRRLASVLKGTRLIGLREKYTSLPLLEEMGVPINRIAVTGDDAVGMAYRAHGATLGASLGVNLRIATYSGLVKKHVEAVRNGLEQFLGSTRAPVRVLAIDQSERSDNDLAATASALPGDAGATLSSGETPQETIAHTGDCRAVLTGSYHCAVFALSQGIPAVCLAESAYYASKFAGLADQFGRGVWTISASSSDLSSLIATTLSEAWEAAPTLRAFLLHSARQQTLLSMDAYRRAHAIMTTVTHAERD